MQHLIILGNISHYVSFYCHKIVSQQQIRFCITRTEPGDAIPIEKCITHDTAATRKLVFSVIKYMPEKG